MAMVNSGQLPRCIMLLRLQQQTCVRSPCIYPTRVFQHTKQTQRRLGSLPTFRQQTPRTDSHAASSCFAASLSSAHHHQFHATLSTRALLTPASCTSITTPNLSQTRSLRSTTTSNAGMFDGIVKSKVKAPSKSIDLVLGAMLADHQPRLKPHQYISERVNLSMQGHKVIKELTQLETWRKDHAQKLTKNTAKPVLPIAEEDVEFLCAAKLTSNGTVEDVHVAKVTEMYERIPKELRLQSGIFSKHLLVSSVQALVNKVNNPKANHKLTYSELWKLLAAESDLIEEIVDGKLTTRQATLHVQQVMPHMLGHRTDGTPCGVHNDFVLPLGGVDVNRFVGVASAFAPGTIEFVKIATRFTENDRANYDDCVSLIKAWEKLPAAAKALYTNTGEYVQVVKKVVYNWDLMDILPHFEFKHDWIIADSDWTGSELNVPVEFLQATSIVTKLTFDEHGRLSPENLDIVTRFELPSYIPRSNFETPEALVLELQDLHRYMSIKKTPHPDADAMYSQWYNIYGTIPVPIEKAHAFFKHGTPLLSDQELVNERRYRHPMLFVKPAQLAVKESFDDDTKAEEEDEEDDAFKAEVSMYKHVRQGDISMPLTNPVEVVRDPGHFTARAKMHKAILQLERYIDFMDAFELPDLDQDSVERARLLALINAEARKISEFSWLGHEQMQKSIGVKMGIAEYRSLVGTLNSVWTHKHAGLVRDRLSPFMRAGVEQVLSKKKSKVDVFGRVNTIGRRKNSTAAVYFQPGTGEIVVNGKTLNDYFARPVDRYEVLRPLEMTDLLSGFDASFLVKGGGNAGQAGACRHAITRAIMQLKPEHRVPLKRVGFVTRDSRMVESKKPGQKKARKKFQWVKR